MSDQCYDAQPQEPERDEYAPFDQDKWLGPRAKRPALIAWEKAHGHDVRLKCYVEFGCQVIEPTLEREIASLRTRLEQLEESQAAWRRWGTQVIAALRGDEVPHPMQTPEDIIAMRTRLEAAEAERDRWEKAFWSKNLYPISEMEQKLAAAQVRLMDAEAVVEAARAHDALRTGHNGLRDALVTYDAALSPDTPPSTDEDDGERCQDCGQRYYPVVWASEDDLWNEVTGSPAGMLCPRCFARRCEARGIYPFFVCHREHVVIRDLAATEGPD